MFGTPQGQRVFHMIMKWSEFFKFPFEVNDTYGRGDSFRNGQRNLAAKIWVAMISDPKERPTETIKRSKQ